MRLLVFGLSGQIGVALRQRWIAGEHPLVAISRVARVPSPGVVWRQGNLAQVPVLPGEAFDAVLSLGPLDHFARWVAATGPVAPRIVAFSSTSVHVKGDSPDPAERDVASRLARAEAQLAEMATRHGLAWVLLRPTLVWGNGRDRSLSRVAALARRWPVLPVPAGGSGRRQPVHVDDLAAAVEAALNVPVAASGAYDLPGGETLGLRDMLCRTIHAAAPHCRPVPVPDGLFGAALRLARLGHSGLLARLQTDLVFDPAPARRVLGWAPRGFRPEPAAFRAG